MNRLVLLLLMLLVVLSPLPLGSNREWSWSLCALLAALVTLLWAVTTGWRPAGNIRSVHPVISVLFLFACAWILVQMTSGVPASWQHPLWSQAAGVLQLDLSGRITLSVDDSWTGLLRLLSYALVFFLAFQLALERSRARAMLGWVVTAGLAYGLFGLVVLWGDYSPAWLFGEKAWIPDLRSTFVNRNHFATWQGLTLLATISLFSMRGSSPGGRPYALPDTDSLAMEQWVLESWKPLVIILLMTTALILTHSRGGFLSTLLAVVTLLLLLDARSGSRRVSTRVAVIASLAVCSLAFWLSSEVLLDRLNRTDISNEDRLVVYENVAHGIAENPALGFGYGTFADAFRLYDRVESPVHYDRAHNTWLENVFELGIPGALALFLALGGLVVTCHRGYRQRHRDWAIPALGLAASVLVAVHALLDFSLQIPAVAILYACIMGIACAQSYSSRAP